MLIKIMILTFIPARGVG